MDLKNIDPFIKQDITFSLATDIPSNYTYYTETELSKNNRTNNYR